MYDANRDKREGYAQALSEIESMVKKQGWIVRDKDKDSERKGEVWLSLEKPMRFDDMFWVSNAMLQIQDDVFLSEKFPELTWESEPVKVELIVRTI